MNALKKTVKLPHNFDDGSQSRVIAFCAVSTVVKPIFMLLIYQLSRSMLTIHSFLKLQSSEDREKALQSGAIHAGSVDLIKMVILAWFYIFSCINKFDQSMVTSLVALQYTFNLVF